MPRLAKHGVLAFELTTTARQPLKNTKVGGDATSTLEKGVTIFFQKNVVCIFGRSGLGGGLGGKTKSVLTKHLALQTPQITGGYF